MSRPAILRMSRFAILLPLCWLVLGCAPGDIDTGSSAAVGDQAATAGADARSVLDDTEKSFVVVGYSTSFVWPAMLQDMLDEHAGGERIYHVLNAVVGGSPMGRWIAAPESEDYQETYGAMLRDFFGPAARLRGDLPAPTVAIIQQSLQRTPTPETRLGPVHDIDDPEGIRIGADALEKLARQLYDDGIERSYFGMHIYKEGYEPEIGNERFALAALLERGHEFIFAGPDVWSPTFREHPDAFAADGLHPNERGMRIMAEKWYRALAGAEARQEIIDAMHAREYDVEAMMQEYFAWRREDDGS